MKEKHEPEFGRLKLALIFFSALFMGLSQIPELPPLAKSICGVAAAACGAALAYLLTPPSSDSFKSPARRKKELDIEAREELEKQARQR